MTDFTEDKLAAMIAEAREYAGSHDDLVHIVRQVASFDKRDVTMMEMLMVVAQAVRAVKAIDALPEPVLTEGALETIEIDIPDGVALHSAAHPVPHAFTQPDYPSLVADAMARHPGMDTDALVGVIMREQHGKTNPNRLREMIIEAKG